MFSKKSKLTALINGITGQDGSLLAKHLLGLGYQVVGLSRKITQENIKNLVSLDILDKLELVECDVHSIENLITILHRFLPTEVYELSGESSVANSFINPEQAKASIINSAENWLQAILLTGINVKFFNPCSSDCFGDTENPATETTPFNPLSPYAEAKKQVFDLVTEYRNNFGIYCTTGILFNHESNFRRANFFSKKIITGAYNISKGNARKLEIGNLNFSRDWGWAPEYVVAIHLSLQAKFADDYIIATGSSITAEEFIDYAFKQFNLNWRDYCEESQTFKRPFDITKSQSDPSKVFDRLGWKASTNAFGVIDKMTSFIINENKLN
jgi:GDPmannose 4,6-dehydratase